MMKQILVFFLFSCLVFGCAGSNLENLSTASPNSSTLSYDAGQVPQPNPYTVELPPASEVRLPTPNEDSGERVRPLRQGEAAPMNGLLFNGPAVARLEIEFRGQAAQCLIDRRADQQRLIARATADIQQLQTTIETDRRVNNILLEARDRELRQIYGTSNELIRRSSVPNVLNTVLWTAGGVLAGAGLVSVLYLFVPRM